MKLTTFVVSHSQDLLDAVPSRGFLQKVHLDALDLPTRYLSQDLAESRFLLRRDLELPKGEFVGFVSARWDERFPDWPSLANIDSLVSKLERTPDLLTCFAPSGFLLSGYQTKLWLKRQDVVHPGMTALLYEILLLNKMEILPSRKYSVVMGNNFIIPQRVASEFLDFWQKSFEYLVQKYQLDFPFSYRCARCGVTDQSGIGRYTRVRHAGFLLERLTALFFISRSDLVLHKPTAEGIKAIGATYFSRRVGLGLAVYQPFRYLKSYLFPCRESH